MSVFTLLPFLRNGQQDSDQIRENFEEFVQQKVTGAILFLLFIIFVTTTGVMGQTGTTDQKVIPPETSSETPEKVPEMQPIAASDIPKASEETISQLGEIRGKIKPLDNIKETGLRFKTLKAETDQLQAQLDETNLEELKYNRLLSIQTSWENIKTSMSAWQNNLQSRSQELETYGQVLQENQKLWEMTSNASKERDDPEAIRSRINEVLDSILVVDKVLKTRQEAVLTLMDQVSQESIRINKAQARIKEAQVETRAKIFAIDSPPLWKAFHRTEKSLSISR